MKRINSPLIILAALFLVFAVWGGIVSLRGDKSVYYEGNDPAIPTLNVYTYAGVTTPHLAFFAAILDGETRGLFNFKIHLWKTPDDLLSNVMAGNGDLWVGHTEGFAVARLRGAPVQMLLFTSFHKFYILTSENAEGLSGLRGGDIAFAPPGSPALALFEKIMERYSLKIKPVSYQGRELEMMLVSGRVKSAVLPEPLASTAILKNGSLRVIGNVEDIFCFKTGAPGPLPVAGIALNEFTERKYHDRIVALQKIIIKKGAKISQEGESAARYLPPYFKGYIPERAVENSLLRDRVSARGAYEMKDELAAYLTAVYPSLFSREMINEWSEKFLWRD